MADPSSAQQPVKKKRRRRREGDPEEEPQLRRVCDACTKSKIRCNGEKPCDRCSRRDMPCDYTFKKRCGPKRRMRPPESGSTNAFGEGLLADSAKSSTAGPETAHGSAVDELGGFSGIIGQAEHAYLRVFILSINGFVPLTTIETIRQALSSPIHALVGINGGVGAVNVEEDEALLFHARKAILFGAIALGAGYMGKPNEAAPHANRARQEIKECFDATIPELVGAYLIMALYWVHRLDPVKVARYMGLARQTFKDIIDPPADMAASLQLISVIVYFLKVVPSLVCHVSRPNPLSGELNPKELPHLRVLNITSFVLMAIHGHVAEENGIPLVLGVSGSCGEGVGGVGITTGTGAGMGGMGAGGESTAKSWAACFDQGTLLQMTSEAEELLELEETPSDMARCLVKALKGYLLLCAGCEREAVGLTEAVADMFGDNPTILHLPLSWTLARCVHALMKRSGRLITVERLDSVMKPLGSRLSPAAAAMSVVEQDVMDAYSGRKKEKEKEKDASDLGGGG